MYKKKNFICLAGIDGSGKSTVAKYIISRTEGRFHYVWARWEPFLLSPFITFINKKSRDSEQVPDEETQHKNKQDFKRKFLKFTFVKQLWLFLAELDYFIQLLRKVVFPYIIHRNIICDRYIYDFYVDQLINLQENAGSMKKFVSRRMLSIFPKPDLLLYIKILPETGNARKQDGTSVAYLAQRKDYYDQLINIYKTIEINGESELENVLDNAINELSGHLNHE
jgi:thymidylate kinase